jgi:hypothetical protein
MSSYHHTLKNHYKERVTFALYSKFQVPKLYRYAAHGEWDKIPARCKSHPKEVVFHYKYALCDTPLHALLRPMITEDSVRTKWDEENLKSFDALQLEAVVAMLETNAKAAAEVDNLGRTPLHLACMSCDERNVEIVFTIAHHYPKAVLIHDVDCRTPLHYLMARCNNVTLPTLKALLNVFSDAINVEDVTGETPLDILERRHNEILNYDKVHEVFEKLIPTCPRRVSRSGSGGSKTSVSSDQSMRSHISLR